MLLWVIVLVGFVVLFSLFFTWMWYISEPTSATVLATTHVNLQNPPSSIDGVSLGSNVTALLIAQTDPTESGLYLTNPWSLIYKPTKAQTFTILQGTVYANAVISFNPATQDYTLPNNPTAEIVTDQTLQGTGTLTEPLGLAPNGASTGEVMTFDGADWKGQPVVDTSETAGEAYDAWDTGAGVQAWAATVGTITYDGRVYNSVGSAAIGDSYQWTMGSSGSRPSVPGQYYRFRFIVETAGSRGIANILVDNTVDTSVDAYNSVGAGIYASYATEWYQATNTSMTFQITVTGKNPAASNFLFALSSLNIDVLSSIT